MNNKTKQSINNYNYRVIDSIHGFQLKRDDFGSFINWVNTMEKVEEFKNKGEEMLSKINNTGYMSEYTGKYLTQLINSGKYDVYFKHILSKNLNSINNDGIYCDGYGLSAGVNNVPKVLDDVDLMATVYKIDNMYNAVAAIKSVSSGISEGGNPIDGVLIIKVPKGTSIESMLYWNKKAACFCIDPKYNDTYIAVDRNCNVKDPIFIDHDVTILDSNGYGVDVEIGEGVVYPIHNKQKK